MKYYLIAGERSGDMHGANLMKTIQKHDPEAEFRFWGGDKMQAIGGELVHHYKDMAFMGVTEIIKNLRKIMGFIKECKKDVLAYQPDLLILIDYSGFNMKIAKFAKKNQIRNFYYISPKIWAWNTKRAYKIKENVDRMFVILPFEVDFYQKFDYKVDYVGNPLLDAVEAFEPASNFRATEQLSDKPIIALLPGSRKQEVLGLLGPMLDMLPHFPNHQLVVAGVSNLDKKYYAIAEEKQVKIVFDQTYDLLHVAEAALVTSGTATLETALFNVPQVVCYKTNPLTYFIATKIVKVKIDFFSLVNLIAQKAVVTELLQKDCNPDTILAALQEIVEGGTKRPQVLQDYEALRTVIGESGASERAANLMIKYLKEAKA